MQVLAKSIGIGKVEVPGSDRPVIVREINNRLLIDRKDFIRYFESKATTDRLVHSRQLTPFFANGRPKRKVNGKYPSTRTLYCLKEWQDLDYSA